MTANACISAAWPALNTLGLVALAWLHQRRSRDAAAVKADLVLKRLESYGVRSVRHNQKRVATPEQVSADEVGTLEALSNAELGELFAATCRDQAARRTGSSRDHWRKMLDEPDMIGLRREFRRRAELRAEETAAWRELNEHWRP